MCNVHVFQHIFFSVELLAIVYVLSMDVHGYTCPLFIQADVYVNTAHNQLNLNHGAVAQSLLKTGGSTIQDECKRVVAMRGTIPYWDIATTSGGNLQCKHIIHTVGANYQSSGCEQVRTLFHFVWYIQDGSMPKLLSNIATVCVIVHSQNP